MGSEYWKMGAAELSAAYASGAADPVEAVAELSARIGRLNPGLNAYVALAPDLQEQARAASDRRARGAALSALDGVPIAVKDNLMVAGMPAAWGSHVFGQVPAEADELPIARLRAAGAILVGKTNTPEFAVEGYTDNARFGPTGNPWDPALTPGGSSGGSVAAVAAGLAHLGVGTDGGGSIRRPAGHTGLCGLKPTIGAVARGGGMPQILMDFEVVGPLARSIKDLALLFDALAGPDRRDPVSRCNGLQAVRPPLRVLVVPTLGDNPCDPQIRSATEHVAAEISALGHRVSTGDLPLDLEPINAFWGRFAQIGLAHMVETIPRMAEHAQPKYLEMAAEGAKVPAPALFAALEEVKRLRAACSALFAEWDVIVTPTAAAQPWPAAEPFPPEIDGQPVGPRGHAVYTGWVNAAGHPALAIPAGRDAAGLPIGVQLIGDLFAEPMLLDLGRALEARGPGWVFPVYAEG